MNDLQKAFQHFKDVQLTYKAYFDYYDGNQPLRYSTERLRTAFDQIKPMFRENWCAVVINAVLDRLELFGWSTADDKLNSVLASFWKESCLALESNEVHESALVCGESFLIGWQDEGEQPEFYYNDPRRAAVFYDESHPRIKSFGAKWWDTDEGCHMMLYYPDHLEHYIADGKAMKDLSEKSKGRGFALSEEIPNPYGIIPVFHFRNSLRTIKSDLKDVTEPQDAINKLFCDMMVTAEFGAFPARYVISSAEIDTLNNAPNQIWDLPAGLEGQQNTQVGTLEAANLGNYSDQIDHLASAIATITNTPKHYFDKTGAQISGEALITMEAPLVKKVMRKRELFGDTWQEVAVFAAQMLGYTISKNDIEVQWGNAEAEQPLTETDILKGYRSAGLPLKSSLRLSGYTPEEIAIIEQEIAEENENNADLANAYLERARTISSQQNFGE